MFSEYASHFLAQSQSRLSLGGNRNGQNDSAGRGNPSSQQDRYHRSSAGTMNPNNSRFGSSRYLQRPGLNNSPYNPSGSQYSRFPLGSRAGAAQAPLFYSATDEFREEDDQEEHEREVALNFALQQSRAHFAGSRLSESSEVEDDGGNDSSIERSGGGSHSGDMPGFGGRGIKSSWRGDRIGTRGRKQDIGTLDVREERSHSRPTSQSSEPSSKGKGQMVNVDLESTVRDSIEELRKDEIPDDLDDSPPVVQKLRNTIRMDRPASPLRMIPDQPEDEETARLYEPDRESIPANTPSMEMGSPRYDSFWAHLFWICFAMMFATSFLIWLHTSIPSKIGDSIYPALHKSFFQLAVYTIVAVFVSQLWLALLRYHAKKLIVTMLVAVPVILISFSIYTMVNSYKVSWAERSYQDEAMRWFSVLPFGAALFWIYTVFKGRHSFGKATEILEFSCNLLANHPALLFVGFAHLAIFTFWTWMWMLMFARVFLTGHLESKNLWIISGPAWALGVFFILMYLWTIGILSGIQRSITAATVSQWYFHRLNENVPHSRAVVQASLGHATGTMYGTICLSSLLTLLARLPLMILPRRLAGMFSMFFYSIIPTPIATLTNPLTLTYASIYSQPLSVSARSLAHMTFVSRISPSTTLTPGDFSPGAAKPLKQYNLAKLLLHATRYMAVVALGLGGWVSTARTLKFSTAAQVSYSGSLYAYVVGLVSAAIGWGVLGAMEGVLTGIVDALVVCWGSETGGVGAGEARYCREAGELFGEGRGAPF